MQVFRIAVLELLELMDNSHLLYSLLRCHQLEAMRTSHESNARSENVWKQFPQAAQQVWSCHEKFQHVEPALSGMAGRRKEKISGGGG